jgi:hypothetical protein
MIEEFRALGGTAVNVLQRVGVYGSGLFPVDSTKPVEIHIPESLLIPAKWVREDGSDLVIDEKSGLDARSRTFFTRYQGIFSWGREGRQDALSWVNQIASLPEGVRRFLRDKLGFRVPQENPAAGSALARFLSTRCIRYRGEMVLMPVIELINHSPRVPGYEVLDGIRVTGVHADEIFACYSISDSLGRFFDHGFVCDENAAFSLPFVFHDVFGVNLAVRRQITKRQGSGGLPFQLPTVENTAEGIVISHLLLGNEFRPRVPRSIFRRILPQFGPEKADEVFDRIRAANIRIFVDFLKEMEGHDTAGCAQLREVTRMQLSGLAGCYGVRDLDTLPV